MQHSIHGGNSVTIQGSAECIRVTGPEEASAKP
jgi:hypothetical protein